jgi:hypothetical protein
MLQWHPRLVRLLLFAVVLGSLFGAHHKPLNIWWA